MKANQPQPPKRADRLLSWFCKDEVLENVQGDLHEVYHDRVERLGVAKANRLFVLDALSVVRPRLIKRLEGSSQSNQFGVFKNSFRASARSIKRHVFFSSMNVVGLAISMSVGILMIVFLSEIYSFDDFHSRKDQIYRVITKRNALFKGEEDYFASTSHNLGDQIEAHIPQVEKVLILQRNVTANLRLQDRAIVSKGYYASKTFFDIFSFELVHGNPRTALQNPGAIVLTESTAKKLFADSNPIGRTLTVDENPDFKDGIITGIVKDPPRNSHLYFDMHVSMKTLESSMAKKGRNFQANPGSYTQSYVYVVLNKRADVKAVESLMANMMADDNAQRAPMTYSLEPMEAFVTSSAGLQPGPAFSKQKINLMIGLSIVVLLSACFNYTNLSLALALRRFKEISIRKVTGATRLQIFSQFITEAVLLSLIASLVGIGLFFLIKPRFLNLPSLMVSGQEMFSLEIDPMDLGYFLLFAIIIGSVAGFLPALLLSKIKASNLLGDVSKTKLFSGFSGKQILTTFQFTLSISLIMCAVMMYQQYKYALNYDLGYKTENILNISVKGNNIDVLENEYDKLSGVVATSKSTLILGTRSAELGDAISEDQNDTIMFSSNYIDANYLDMHGFQLLAGSAFTTPVKEGDFQSNIIVNETFLNELKLGLPEKAIGKTIRYYDDQRLTIQGVVKDFVSMSLDAEAPKAFVFFNRPENENGILGVKVRNDNLLAIMEKFETIYKKMDPVHPFEATFYNDEIARTYESSKATYTIISFLAFLAVSISTLGLLGMVVFTTESRMKEICIRKVLGAGVGKLMLMLSQGFLIMFIISAVIAIPLSRYVVNDFILSKFLYRNEIGLMDMLSGFIVVVIIGALAVGWKVRRAAVQNPADLLRDE